MFYIRADANEQTGAGHMMRCLTIAKAASDDVTFLCADEASAALPEAYGFQTRILHTDYRNMEAELPVLSALLAGNRPTILVDSYHVTDTYLAVLRAFARVVLIDDNMERAYPADAILNYNFHANPDVYASLYANDGTRIVTGPSFAPVREQFLNRDYKVREAVEKILILAGGSDPLNAAGEIYTALRQKTAPKGNEITSINKRNNDHAKDAVTPAFTIVCGKYSTHAGQLQARAKEDETLRILHDVEDMASLMCESDLCITACGSTIYELCAVGVPFVCYALADNQLGLAAYLEENGPAPYCGAFHTDRERTLEKIVTESARIASDYQARVAQCLEQRKLVDGNGARRIAQEVLQIT